MAGKREAGIKRAAFALKSSLKNRLKLIAAVAALSAPAASWAVDFDWAINSSGLFDTVANWTPAGGPPNDNLDRALFDQTGTYTVTFQNPRTNNSFVVSNGNVTFALSGHTYTHTAAPSIGIADGQTARLTLLNGVVAAPQISIATSSADTGFLTISSNALVDLTGGIVVADGGTGTLIIQSGGDLITDNQSQIANAATGLGAATVSGAGSSWVAGNVINVGQGGTGSLTVSAGGLIRTQGLAVGTTAAGVGTLNVTGADSFVTSFGLLRIGFSGTGTAIITSGGWLNTSSNLLLGENLLSTGTATVTGVNSRLSSLNHMIVGGSGNGTVEALAGAAVTVSGSVLMATDVAAARGDVVVDGNGSTWTIDDGLTVGSLGTATFTISNGGKTTGGTLITILGDLAGSNGRLNVTGAGSSFTSQAGLVVGDAGTGTLSILDGGVVTNSAASFVANTGGTGTVTIGGAGSTWTTPGLGVGSGAGGNASLTVENEGTVNVTGGMSLIDPTGAPTATINLRTGGSLNVSGGFTNRGILNFTGGLLHVSGGTYNHAAALTPLLVTGSTAGDLAIFRLSGNANTANISTLDVGNPRRGAVEVLSGARLTTAGAVSIGGNGGTGTVLVDGPGSNWTAGAANTIFIGAAGVPATSGTLTISNGGAITIGNLNMGTVSAGSGFLNVTGAGSSFTTSATTDIGDEGTATVLVAGGANASLSNVVVGRNSTASAQISVDGPGTRFLVSGSLEIGRDGDAIINVRNGAEFGSTGITATIASNTNLGTGIVNISEGGGWFARTINLGTASGGQATINVNDGGVLRVSNGLNQVDPAASSSILRIDGGDVTITGTYSRRGTLDFRNGTLTMNAGTLDFSATTATMFLEAESGAGKLVTLRLTGGSTTTGIGSLLVGGVSAGAAYIQHGSSLNAANFFIGSNLNGHGEVLVEGSMNTLGQVSVGGGTSGGPAGVGVLNIPGGGQVNTGTLTLFAPGTINLNGGSISMATFNPQGGTFNFNSGQVFFSNATTLTAPALDKLLGPGRILRSGQRITGNSDLTVGTGLIVNGGTLESMNQLVVQSGSFLRVIGGTASGTASVSNHFGGVVSIEGGVLTTPADVINNGEIVMHGAASMLTAANVVNQGLITGGGRITAPLNNMTSGEVRAQNQRLTFHTDAANQGTLNLLDGTIEVLGTLTNHPTGRIGGRGMMLVRSELINNGQIAFSGGISDLHGEIINNSAARIIVTGGGLATFYGDITHNPGADIRVSAGSVGVFLGAINGTGSFSGSGTKHFEGGGSAVGAISTAGASVVSATASLSASLIREDSLTVNGQVTINTSGGTSHLNELVIEGGTDAWDGVLDLKNNSLVLEGGDLALVTNQIRSGLYEGTGITSSAPGSPFRLGSMLNSGTFHSSFMGIGGLDGDEVLIRYTRIGDLNLDGTVSIADFIDLAAHFNMVGGASWQDGDVNYDGSVSISDFIELASNFNQSISGVAAGWNASELAMVNQFAASIGAAAVPEPLTLAPLGLALLALPRPRRRSR